MTILFLAVVAIVSANVDIVNAPASVNVRFDMMQVKLSSFVRSLKIDSQRCTARWFSPHGVSDSQSHAVVGAVGRSAFL